MNASNELDVTYSLDGIAKRPIALVLLPSWALAPVGRKLLGLSYFETSSFI